jgi:hypothetical protein
MKWLHDEFAAWIAVQYGLYSGSKQCEKVVLHIIVNFCVIVLASPSCSLYHVIVLLVGVWKVHVPSCCSMS